MISQLNMQFEISLLCIFFAKIVWGQENNPIQCAQMYSGDFYIGGPVPFILQTPTPIRNSWDAFIYNHDYPEYAHIKIDFDIPVEVEVYLEKGDNRTKLVNDIDTGESTITRHYSHRTRYLYKIFKISVRNTFNNATPHITGFVINKKSFDSCSRLMEIPFEMIHLYKISPLTDALIADPERNSTGHSLISFIQDYYSTTITSLHTMQDELSSYCGKRSKNNVTLITNTHYTNPGDWPWHAAIFYKTHMGAKKYRCGGTLITRNAILTAAVCVYGGNFLLILNRIVIILGLYNKLRTNLNSQEFRVHQIIPHENFTTNTFKNDIAILQLEMEATLNNYVQPVCLWFTDKVSIRESEGKTGYVVGWGITGTEQQKHADDLIEIKMPVVSHEDCLDRNNDFYGQYLSVNTFCAGYRNGTSICSGDNGGGMFFRGDDDIFRIRGIVSLNRATENLHCNPYEFVIFTNVGRYLNWIENTIAEKF